MKWIITCSQVVVKGDGSVDRPVLEVEAEAWTTENGWAVFYAGQLDSALGMEAVAMIPSEQVLYIVREDALPSVHGSQPQASAFAEAST